MIAPSSSGGFEISGLTPTGNARLHLQVGDRIMSIGSVATSGKTDAEVKALIIGPAGSTISMVRARRCSHACSSNSALPLPFRL